MADDALPSTKHVKKNDDEDDDDDDDVEQHQQEKELPHSELEGTWLPPSGNVQACVVLFSMRCVLALILARSVVRLCDRPLLQQPHGCRPQMVFSPVRVRQDGPPTSHLAPSHGARLSSQ